MDTSLYAKTSNNGYYMSYYSPIDIPLDSTDYFITIDMKYHNKPGRLAYDLYGSERLGWVFRYFNNNIINDPIFDLNGGMTILVPTKERLMRYL
jgi:hypothetical protein